MKRTHYNHAKKQEGMFTVSELLQACEIKQGIFYADIEKRYLPDGIKVQYGDGVRTLYSRHDARQIFIFGKLVSLGIQRKHAANITQKFWPENFSDAWAIVAGFEDGNPRIVSGNKPETLLKTLSDHLAGVVLDLRNLIAEIDGKLDGLK
ncbi:MAG: hypothetical protein COX19_06610 [Desulfobacterales bacterium CG23_combo_of_CG06-09_8_20_14_all_51_8]|nr:MAG: hypothetical protein COX19_06610 [Desulfobacterales bacterium CG23_combo_of_CG06-09_8_20_14_all_51_8]